MQTQNIKKKSNNAKISYLKKYFVQIFVKHLWSTDNNSLPEEIKKDTFSKNINFK